MSNRLVAALYVLPALLLLLVLVYIPIVLTGYYGLMQWDGIGAMTFIGLDNYARLLQDSTFWQSANHTFLLALFSALSLIGYLMIALVLSGKIKGANFFAKYI